MNKISLLGRLGQDPEVINLNNGGRIVKFSLATSERWKDKNTGERKEKTEWHRIVIFNENLGKIAESYLEKGSRVYLEGSVETRKWQNSDGKDVFTTEVVLANFKGFMEMIDFKQNQNQQQSQQQTNSNNNLDDDIPF